MQKKDEMNDSSTLKLDSLLEERKSSGKRVPFLTDETSRIPGLRVLTVLVLVPGRACGRPGLEPTVR